MAGIASLAPSKNYFVGIIDGTGPESDTEYKRVMAGGFCKQFEAAFLPGCRYERGPSASGAGLGDAVTGIVRAIKEQFDRDPTKDIVLIGYSRGALGCVIVAHKLAQEHIDVHTMVLLDAVDRYAGSPYKLVPSNVKASFRAYRRVSTKLVLKYEGTIPTIGKSSADGYWARFKNLLSSIGDLVVPSNPIRPSFSSTALGVARGRYFDATDADQHRVINLDGSHGAMGGVGYKWVAEDGPCQKALINALTAWLSVRLDKKISLLAGYDPDLTAPAVGGVVRMAVATAGAGYDLTLMAAQRVDELAYAVRGLLAGR